MNLLSLLNLIVGNLNNSATAIFRSNNFCNLSHTATTAKERPPISKKLA